MAISHGLHGSELIEYPNRPGRKARCLFKVSEWQDSSLDPEELAATSMETLGGHMVFADVLTRAEKEKQVPARAMVGARGWKIPS